MMDQNSPVTRPNDTENLLALRCGGFSRRVAPERRDSILTDTVTPEGDENPGAAPLVQARAGGKSALELDITKKRRAGADRLMKVGARSQLHVVGLRELRQFNPV